MARRRKRRKNPMDAGQKDAFTASLLWLGLAAGLGLGAWMILKSKKKSDAKKKTPALLKKKTPALTKKKPQKKAPTQAAFAQKKQLKTYFVKDGDNNTFIDPTTGIAVAYESLTGTTHSYFVLQGTGVDVPEVLLVDPEGKIWLMDVHQQVLAEGHDDRYYCEWGWDSEGRKCAISKPKTKTVSGWDPVYETGYLGTTTNSLIRTPW